MCLHTKAKRLYTSKNDIKVWKIGTPTILFDVIETPFQHAKLQLNVLLQPISINIINYPVFHKTNSMVFQGYHAYLTKHTAETMAKFLKFNGLRNRIPSSSYIEVYEATILAGTKYVRGYIDTIVTETMMIHSK